MNICFNFFEVVVHRIFLLKSSLLSLLGLFVCFHCRDVLRCVC